VTVEEAAVGGFGATCNLGQRRRPGRRGLKIRTMRPTASRNEKPEKQYDEARLNAPHIVETVLKALRINSAGMKVRA
jgi:1-deoxy-D-xylulose-5-phosphate synthase